MSGKMKGLLVVLLLGATISLVSVFDALGNPGHVTALADPMLLRAQSLGLLERPRDTDGDGLTDQEETYWKTDFRVPDSDGDGFKDGEEALSGHNPSVAGPDDWLDRSKNLTQQTTDLAVGGILTGNLTPGTTVYDASVQRLAESILERYRQNTKVLVDDITLTPTDDADARAGYVFRMALIINNILVPTIEDAEKFLRIISDVTLDDPSPLTDDPKRFAAFATVARRLAQVSGDRALQVAATPAPRTFAVQHKNAIRLLRTLQRYYELAATLKDDPIQGMVALQALVTLHTETLPLFMADFGKKVATATAP